MYYQQPDLKGIANGSSSDIKEVIGQGNLEHQEQRKEKDMGAVWVK
jgi:hypothetical protein